MGRGNIEKKAIWNFDLVAMDGVQKDMLPGVSQAGLFGLGGKRRVSRDNLSKLIQAAEATSSPEDNLVDQIEMLKNERYQAILVLDKKKNELALHKGTAGGFINVYNPDVVKKLEGEISELEALIDMDTQGIKMRVLNQREVIHSVRE